MIFTLTQETKQHDVNRLHDAFITAGLVPSHVESTDTESRFTFPDGTDEGDIQDVVDAYVYSEPVPYVSPLDTIVALTPTEGDVMHFRDGEWRSDPTAVAVGYKEYAALLQNDGTNPPDATVLYNSLGGAVVLSRNSEGSYQGTLAGAFPPSRTVFVVGQYQYLSAPYADNVIMRMEADPSGDSFLLEAKIASDGTPADGYLQATLIVVRVYDEL